ncbi:MFS transporter [Streptomyces sp. AJS327]|uniref:MFS transporter n=1 Tax=Streptomyces sp. AJS327 TaxID=2545265 RepID=UPI0015DE46B5|nr:MFS transporter [Streptomyces sp. AJS327]MBA0049537.1 MFS transporter [Streptomyces sp. AJS327]QTC09992.1 MFS transporter [Streptomyces sp.]
MPHDSPRSSPRPDRAVVPLPADGRTPPAEPVPADGGRPGSPRPAPATNSPTNTGRSGAAEDGPGPPRRPGQSGAPTAASGRRGTVTRWAAPYGRLFRRPGTVAFTLGSVLARLPMGMFGISAVIMIAGSRGSYALAGAVTATGLAATAVVAPLTARMVDRYGQARIALPATLLAACGSLALVACVHYDAPHWTLFASYAATATTPNTGGMSRARWAHLHPGDGPGGGARHTANSLEQALDEMCFMLGPVLAALLCTALFPEAGTLAGVALLVVGMALFTAQRSTEPPAGRGESGRSTGRAPIRLPGVPPLLVTFLCTGAVFGSLEVVTVGFADSRGQQAAGGVVLACQAAGSGLAGLAFGALRPRLTAERRLPRCVAAMAALLTLPLLTAWGLGSLLVLGVALLVAGMATAPTMVTGMTLLQERTPAARLNEGMTLAVTALLCGVALGSALGGWATEHWAPALPYALPPAAAVAALLTTFVPAARRLPRVG